MLLTGSGCANDHTADPGRANHFANRTNRLGSNIPQPASAGSDNETYSASEMERMRQQSNTTGAMQASGGGGVVH